MQILSHIQVFDMQLFVFTAYSTVLTSTEYPLLLKLVHVQLATYSSPYYQVTAPVSSAYCLQYYYGDPVPVSSAL